ncbi:TetR/AcrR family transcriptional regulator [Bradyrhizobium sp. G127]|uniref:TetR/AcrR family transcriptional regulator n=1 Tax=Bradyrhizobium sp. G127 TaxID=2904800 RepID=UPI001F3CF3BB|nr:TetR/AcrR family transcriptional regulator [Bradyrhizobium sp. G127]MCF2521924.1 TetR/AcrR family transcriptional regulator [Bradyrhizobium sp. G127]
MVQKKKRTAAAPPAAPKKRGRPRAFEPDAALEKAMNTFRDGGFAATSLDDLSQAMGINRPSLYGTFGDKRDLFLKAYERYRAEMAERFAPAFDPALTLRQMLEKIYAIALDVYLAGENGPRGCFTVMTATSEAMADAEIRPLVQRALGSTQRALARRFQAAVESGELPSTVNVQVLAQIGAATVEALAIRSRARVPRADLEAIAAGTIDLICGPKAR